MAIYYKNQINCNLFVETGLKSNKRILNISKISDTIGKDMSNALPAMHAVSGCDSTSAFFGIDKHKFYKNVKGSGCSRKHCRMGNNFEFHTSLFPVIQTMIAQCYGVKECSNINDARYRKFGTKAKVPDPQQLPPTEDELLLHCRSANYVSGIWKSALTATTNAPSPFGDESKTSSRFSIRIIILRLQEIRV